MLILFQVLFSLFAIFAVSAVIGKKHSGLLSVSATMFWFLFWLFATVFVWWPNSTVRLANFFGIGRGSDLVLYVSLAIIFFFLFRIGVKIESLNRDLTKVVRDKALK